MNAKVMAVFFLSMLGLRTADAQDTIILRNKIDLRIEIRVKQTSDMLDYHYTLINGPKALQGVWKFWLILSPKLVVESQKAPNGWRASYGAQDDRLIISWGSPAKSDIMPKQSLSGFSVSSSSIPGLIQFYSEGYAKPPSFPAGMAPDSIPGYDDLTPYGPGIVGITIGPVAPPSPFIPLVFLDTLISYKHQAFDLGWFKNRGIVQSLDAKLENAKRQLQRNNTTAAKNILQAFINEVEALWKEENQRRNPQGVQITSEAYALLKFNAEYLLSKL
jgi:hypothetical protein